jgi:hypothetical protein
MGRHSTEVTATDLNRNFPYQVDIEIPTGGLVDRFQSMHELCLRNGWSLHTRVVRSANVSTMIWCFAEAADAEAFHVVFGGKQIVRGPTSV